jgi:hypothetical protein
MNQHEWVYGCYAYYLENCIEPGNPEDGVWEDAHYPAPVGKGNETIPLLKDHHQVQGILQSAEYGCCCFYAGDARKYLTHGPFVPGWFDLWDVYDVWVAEQGRRSRAKQLAETPKEELSRIGRAVHTQRTPEERREFSRAGGLAAAAALTPEQRREKALLRESRKAPEQRRETAIRREANKTKEQRSETGRQLSRAYWSKMTPEERSEELRRRWETRRRNQQSG